MPGDTMEFRILGPLEVLVDEQPVTPRPAKQRTLLALLAVHANEAVSTDLLIEALWDGRPPQTAKTALHGHVSALRKLIGHGRLETRAPGYLLRIEPGELDVERFEREVADARRIEDPAERAGRLAAALSLWRGDALADFRYDDFAQAEIARLEERRASATEDRLEAELELGRHRELLAELEALVAEQPLRERLRSQLMLALYRSGRQGEALHAYQEGRRVLAEELGIDPGPALQALERQILAHDPALDAAPAAAAGHPRQERRRITVLIGELSSPATADLEELDALYGPALERAEGTLRRFGATVQPLFSNALIGIFGTRRAYEDDAERAVGAGAELIETIGEDGRLAVRIGIARGDALITIRGGRVEVTGDVVAVASRRQAAAAANTMVLGDELERTNLPVPVTPFLGRDRELAEVVDLLSRADVRLLTLTGPGGTGKTRLALQAAAECTGAFPDGTWWVPLAPLRQHSPVLPAIAQALELGEAAGQPLADVLVRSLHERKTLLLLDNAEHLLPELGRELAQLRAVEGLVLLVTSRERLQLEGEHVYPVPTLDAADASALFLARARALDPNFEADGAVDDLCSRLENLPLALELAAARTPLFTPAQLLERLSQRLDLLKAARDAEPRQQTLRATFDWSYELLEPDERRLFRRLAVFAGGCTFEAAEEVCGAEPEALQSLLDKSLLRRRQTDTGPRYWMLETMREYAFQRLQEDGAQLELQRRHAEWVARRAEAFHDALATRAQQRDLDLLHPEYGNIAAAVAFAAPRDPNLTARIAAAYPWWTARGRYTELEGWARPLLERDLAPASQAMVLTALLSIAVGREDVNEIESFAAELLPLAHAIGDERLVCAATYYLGVAAFLRGEVERGRALVDEAIERAREGFPARVPAYLGTLGWQLRAAGELAEARSLLDEAVGLARRQDAYFLPLTLAQRANLALDEGDFAHALALYREALASARDRSHRRVAAICLSGIAAALAGIGRHEDAARLWEAALRLGRELTIWTEAVDAERDRELRKHLGGERYAALAAEGRALSEEDAVEYALRA